MPMSEERPVAVVRTRRSKVRIPAGCVRFMSEIDSYIHRYNVRGASLPSAASDVLDGLAMREELEPLVRRRLLAIAKYGDGPAEGMCGWGFSVHLTPRAMNALWPDRVRAPAPPARRRAARKGK